jgi:hypothetical protein
MATEGTLESYIDRRVAIWESIAGITKAFKTNPGALQDAQLIAVIIEPGAHPTQRYGHDTLIVSQVLIETVYLRKSGAHLSDTPVGSSDWALIDAIDMTFKTLDRNDNGGVPQPGVFEATPPASANGVEPLTYGEDEYIAIRYQSSVRYMR